MSQPNIEKDHIAPYRFEFAQNPRQVWRRLSSREYREHRRARRRAGRIELSRMMSEVEK